MTTNLTIQQIYDKLVSISFLNGSQTHNFVIATICDIFNLTKEEVKRQLTNIYV